MDLYSLSLSLSLSRGPTVSSHAAQQKFYVSSRLCTTSYSQSHRLLHIHANKNKQKKFQPDISLLVKVGFSFLLLRFSKKLEYEVCGGVGGGGGGGGR